MPTMAEVVRSMQNRHDEVSWRIGVVLAVDTTKKKLTVQFGGATPGNGTPGVDYIEQIAPTVGKKVHCICTETHGMLAFGTTGSAPPLALPMMSAFAAFSASPEPESEESVVVADTMTTACSSDLQYSGTLVGSDFIPGPVRQAENVIGVWRMQDLGQVITDSMAAGVVTSLEIELTMFSGGPRARLVLLENNGGVPAVNAPPVRSPRLTIDVPTLVAIPLGWLEPLASGQALIGVLADTFTLPADFDAHAIVQVTAQTAE
jgi:hypothetical protein